MVPPQSPAAAQRAPRRAAPGLGAAAVPGQPVLGCSSPLVSVSLRLRAKSLQAAGLPARSSPAGSSAFSALRTLWKIAAPGSFKPACVFTGSLAGGFVALSPGRSSGAELRGRPPAVPPPPGPAGSAQVRRGRGSRARRGAPPQVPTRGLGGWGGARWQLPPQLPIAPGGHRAGKKRARGCGAAPQPRCCRVWGFSSPSPLRISVQIASGQEFSFGCGQAETSPEVAAPRVSFSNDKTPRRARGPAIYLAAAPFCNALHEGSPAPRAASARPAGQPRTLLAPTAAAPSRNPAPSAGVLSTASTSRPRSLGSCLFG